MHLHRHPRTSRRLPMVQYPLAVDSMPVVVAAVGDGGGRPVVETSVAVVAAMVLAAVVVAVAVVAVVEDLDVVGVAVVVVPVS